MQIEIQCLDCKAWNERRTIIYDDIPIQKKVMQNHGTCDNCGSPRLNYKSSRKKLPGGAPTYAAVRRAEKIMNRRQKIAPVNPVKMFF